MCTGEGGKRERDEHLRIYAFMCICMCMHTLNRAEKGTLHATSSLWNLAV